MQATSATYHQATGTDWLTTSSLILIVVLAAITLAAIAYGMRLASQRRAARLTEEQRVEAEATPEPPEQAPPAPPPVIAPAGDPVPPAPDRADAPIATAAPLASSPAVDAGFAATGTHPDVADERPLTTLKGLGPKVASRLNELGLHTIGDLATLDDAQVESIDARLGPFTGRMARDRWPEQARLLAAGDVATFEARFGRL